MLTFLWNMVRSLWSDPCPLCRGAGAAKNGRGHAAACLVCRGRGRVRHWR